MKRNIFSPVTCTAYKEG